MSLPSNGTTDTSADRGAEFEVMRKLCEDVSQRYGCLVTVTREDGPRRPANSLDLPPSQASWSFLLWGPERKVMDARSAILQERPQDTYIFIDVPRRDIVDPVQLRISGNDVPERIRQIEENTGAGIWVMSNDEEQAQRMYGKATYGLRPEPIVRLVLSGTTENVELAKVRVLVMLDQIVSPGTDSLSAANIDERTEQYGSRMLRH